VSSGTFKRLLFDEKRDAFIEEKQCLEVPLKESAVIQTATARPR
jgi:hypothetical protein